jgi:hypothetical protein
MSWTAPLDLYCERLAPGLTGEPFNTLTALAFLAAGGWTLWTARGPDMRAPGLALAVLGLASAASHAVAIRLTTAIDMMANLVYLILLGALMLGRLAGARRSAALAGAAGAVLMGYVAVTSPLARALGPFADLFVLQGGLLLALALGLAARHPSSARGLAAAAAVLALGLPFRFLDTTLCPAFPLGTHGLWHLANAAANAVLLAVLARHPGRLRPRLAPDNPGL